MIFATSLFFMILSSLWLNIKSKDVLLKSISVFLLIIYSPIIRTSGFEIDIITYAEAMKSDSLSIYYLKEPVFWIGSRVVYSFTQSEVITFVVFDYISIYLLYKAFSSLRIHSYALLSFVFFFPILMGMHNVYRQYFAIALFLYSLSAVIQGKSIKSFVFFLLSLLTQNALAMFLPVLILNSRLKNKRVLSLIISMTVVLAMPIALSTKSHSDTGSLGVSIYFLCIFFLLFVQYGLKKFVIAKNCVDNAYSMIFMLLLLLESTFLMGGAQSKRVGMIILSIQLLLMVRQFEMSFGNRIFKRVFMVVFCFAPTFIFPNARQFLF